MRNTSVAAILCGICMVCLMGIGVSGADVLPTGSAPAAIESKHFPSRLHAFVWRNWEMISLERMAKVVGTSPEKVNNIGRSMGLPPHKRPPATYQQRGYISIIRRNWHILPYEQLLTLLHHLLDGIDREGLRDRYKADGIE